MAASLAAHALLVGVAVGVWPRTPANEAGEVLTVRLVVVAPAPDLDGMIGLPEAPPAPEFEVPPPAAKMLPLPPPAPTPVPTPAPALTHAPVRRAVVAPAVVAPAGGATAGVAAQGWAEPGPGAAAVADWRAAVAAWIGAHQRYPAAARRMGVQGVATLRFLLLADGRVSGLAVATGSGSVMLDRAALAVFEGATLPPPPSGTPEAVRWITVPMRYRLAGG